MTLSAIKQSIWSHRKINLSEIKLHTEADRHGIPLPISSVEVAQRFLDLLCKRKIKKKVETPKWVIERYNAAHKAYNEQEFPNWCKDGHYMDPVWPDVGSSNGLTNFICDFLTWSGHFANRTGNEGRVIKNKAGKDIRIQSSSKNGMQDIDTNLVHPSHPFGIPWKIEIKVGADTLSQAQANYGKEVARTGAIYSVVTGVEDFFEQLDKLLLAESKQRTIFT